MSTLTKIIRKIRPNDYWRIGEHESWFTDMAAQGLHLKKMGTHFAHFIQGEPQKMKYRIEVSKGKGISLEQVDLYEENGWEYVTSYHQFHVFSSPEELGAGELHTDPAEQAFTLNHLKKKLVTSAIISVAGMLLIVGMLAALWFLDGTPLYMLVEGVVIQQTIMVIFLSYLNLTTIQATISIYKLRKNLLEGKTIDHHAPWKNVLKFNKVGTWIFTGVIALSAFIPFIQLVKMDTMSLPQDANDLPFVRLAEIEQNLAVTRDVYTIDGIDRGNSYSTNWSPLAPVQYDVSESGIVPGEMWEDESGHYSPGIFSEIYELRFSMLAKKLLDDLIKRSNYDNRPMEQYIEVDHADFDRLVVYEESDSKQLFASKGNVVMYIRYYGYADTSIIIENMAEKMDLMVN